MASTYRLFTPPPAKLATGLAADVYAQLSSDFMGPAPTFTALSPTPELLAATWALMRESLLAGQASRVGKEVVAAAVSRANRCQFCIDAHVIFLHALGEHDLAETIADGRTPGEPPMAGLLDWAVASRTPQRASRPGPSGHVEEYLGTLLAFHFINRGVSALLTESLLPGNLQRSSLVRNLGGRAYARTARQAREPGKSLSLLAGIPIGAPPAWAGSSPIGVAYAALRSVAGRGAGLLGDEARALVAQTVKTLDGAHPQRPADWAWSLVTNLPTEDRLGARIALLAAFSPASISPGDAALWRQIRPADADLIHLVAFDAMTAVEHVEAHLTRVVPAA
ncbi:MAG TPA: carboxymuconolactone decarboxylase family protein [Micromonosporaceae bacterium]